MDGVCDVLICSSSLLSEGLFHDLGISRVSSLILFSEILKYIFFEWHYSLEQGEPAKPHNLIRACGIHLYNLLFNDSSNGKLIICSECFEALPYLAICCPLLIKSRQLQNHRTYPTHNTKRKIQGATTNNAHVTK